VNEQARCPKCASSERIPDALVTVPVDGDHVGVEVEVHRDPEALLFKGATRTRLKATVCGQCGFTQLYAVDPAELLAAHREARSAGEAG
jgi:predicted nucleic-acid-binding Zn-ribbon protein